MVQGQLSSGRGCGGEFEVEAHLFSVASLHVTSIDFCSLYSVQIVIEHSLVALLYENILH